MAITAHPGAMRLAEARLAAEYLARAEAWSREVDQELADELDHLHSRLLERIDELTASPAARH